jgi:hypothetical protein
VKGSPEDPGGEYGHDEELYPENPAEKEPDEIHPGVSNIT